jgi:hypothetical protein
MDASHAIEKLLAELGLQRQRSAVDYFWPALGLFAAGAVLGGAVALLIVPKAANEPRKPVSSPDNGERAGAAR